MKDKKYVEDAEAYVLGACLVDRTGIDIVLPLIKSESVFYSVKNQKVFLAMKSLYEEAGKIDLLTVSNKMDKTGSFDNKDFYLIELMNKVSSTANTQHHCLIVLEQKKKRDFVRLGDKLQKYGLDLSSDVHEVIEETQKDLDAISEQGTVSQVSDASSDLEQGFVDLNEHIKRISAQKDEINGVPSGLRKLDKITNGWQNSDLIIVAARPGMGKTSLAMKLAQSAAMSQVPVAFFSLEMNRQQLVARWVSNRSELHLNQLLRNGFDKDKYWKSFYDITATDENLPLKILDNASLDTFTFRNLSHRLKRQFGIGLIIVDYLQLMSSSARASDDNQEIGQISRMLKIVAKELDVPVIALSQLSRENEKFGDKRPKLSNLRGSGSIEQDADMVVFIHRPEYYGQDVDQEMMQNGENTEIIISKHRNGPVATVGCFFDANKTKFIDKNPNDVFDSIGVNDDFEY